MGLIRISGSGAGVCSEQSCCEAGAARGWFPSLSVPDVSSHVGDPRQGWGERFPVGTGLCHSWSQQQELSPPSAKQQQGSVPCWEPWGQTTAWGQQKSLSSCPFPGPPPGAEGTPAGLGGQVLYFHHTRNPERFLYLIPLVGVEVVDGSAPPLCSSVSRRPSAEGGFCRCFLCVHLPTNKKSPVSFFLPSPRQGIPAPGILHIHRVTRQRLP